MARYAAATARASTSPSATPPTSDLWAIPGSSVLSATGNPIDRAAPTAPSSSVTATVLGTGMP